MGKSFQLAWRNMWRNWRRTAIALTAIVLGLILLMFLNGMIEGSDQGIYGNAVRLYGGNIQVHAPGYRLKANRTPLLPIDAAAADAIVAAAVAQPQVTAASQRIVTGGLVSTRKGAFPVKITAVQPSREALHSIQAENIAEGRYLLDEDSDAVLIGRGLADKLGVTVGDRVTVIGRAKQETMRQRPMTVVGIYDLGMAEAEQGMAFITLPEAQALYNLRGEMTEVAISLAQVGQEATVMPALAAALPGFEVDSWTTLHPEIEEAVATKGVYTTVIGFVVLLIASISILNLMLMAVFERTREMGVLAALGMKGRQVMALFLLEGALIGLVGALIGCTIGYAIILAFGQVGIDFGFASGLGEYTALMGTRIYPSLHPLGVLLDGLAVVIIAALASLYPAWQASRKEPAAALHHI
jgi:ABC-type lipoprotein release transport system permease subunit